MKTLLRLSLLEMACMAVLAVTAWVGGHVFPLFADLGADGWVLIIGAIVLGIVKVLEVWFYLAKQKEQKQQLELIHKAVNSQSSAAKVEKESLEDTILKIIRNAPEDARQELMRIVAADKENRERKAAEIVAQAAAAKGVAETIEAQKGTLKEHTP